MTDETALLVAAQADPTARLVYADCLDEQGKPLDAALQRVLAEPHEDRHRLDYAAVCERNGDAARAEFIRVQIQLELESAFIRDKSRQLVREHGDGLLPHAGIHSAYELALRERHLWEKNWLKWVGPIARFRPCGRDEVGQTHYVDHVSEQRADFITTQYVRGFIGSLTCTAADWLAHGDAILAQHPVTAVTLTTHPDVMFLFTLDEYPGNVISHHERLLGQRWPGVAFTLPA